MHSLSNDLVFSSDKFPLGKWKFLEWLSPILRMVKFHIDLFNSQLLERDDLLTFLMS